MENKFFTQLSEIMEDRQECVVNIKKIGTDLVIMVTLDIKKKGTVLHMSGNPAEIDLNFLHEIKKPIVAKTDFKAEVTENEELNDEDDTEPRKGGESTKDYQNRLTGKGKGNKKAAKPNKIGKSKPGPKNKEEATIANGKKLMRTKRDEKDFSAKIEADKQKREKEEADAKAKANKEAFDKLMGEGKALMAERKYEEAETNFKSALELFPEDAKAKKELEQATKWVEAVKRMMSE